MTLQPFHLWDLIVNSLHCLPTTLRFKLWESDCPSKNIPYLVLFPPPPPSHPICLKLHLYGREKFLFGSCVWEWLFYCLRNQTTVLGIRLCLFYPCFFIHFVCLVKLYLHWNQFTSKTQNLLNHLDIQAPISFCASCVSCLLFISCILHHAQLIKLHQPVMM